MKRICLPLVLGDDGWYVRPVMRRGLLLAVVMLLTVAVPAQAHSVSAHRAERAISHWWLGKQPPRIEWCARERYGDLCALRIPAAQFDCGGPFCGDIHGYDKKIIWVSRTHGKTTVADVGDYLSVTIS